MNKESLIQQLTAAHADIMRFWIDNMVDDANGGFYGELDCKDNVVPNAPKGLILNGRILWTFAKAANTFGGDEYRKMADRAFDYLCKYFHDNKNGGFYWSLNADGSPLDTKKQAYAQGFALYGLSE